MTAYQGKLAKLRSLTRHQAELTGKVERLEIRVVPDKQNPEGNYFLDMLHDLKKSVSAVKDEVFALMDELHEMVHESVADSYSHTLEA